MKRHHEMNTLASTVNSVKLMQDEENSINQIFDILNEGDYFHHILKDRKIRC